MNMMLATPHPTLRFDDVRFRPSSHLRDFYSPGKLRLTYNARAAFYQLLCSLRESGRRTVLLPAFHCTALVEPVPRAGFKADFYRLLPDFRPDLDDVRRRFSDEVAVIVVIHYFGFPVDLAPFLRLRAEFGGHVVEDCAHSFLSRNGTSFVGHGADFSLFSFYKFVPSLAGGGLGINLEGFPEATAPATVSWREQLTLAKRLFEQMLENSPENPASKILLKAERWRVNRRRSQPSAVSHSVLVDDPYLFREELARSGMPGICRRILECNNWDENRAARRRNYSLFSEEIQDGPHVTRVLPDLPEGVCPWAFPILLPSRSVHDKQLRELGVPVYSFGEILHPLLANQNDQARRDAERLSEQLLLLPVHAQLDATTVREIARRIKMYLSACQQAAWRPCADSPPEELCGRKHDAQRNPMNREASSKIEILDSREAILGLREVWNQLVLENSGSVEQLDLTSSFEWAACLWESHLQGQTPTVAVFREDQKIVGLLPIRRFRRSIRGLSCNSFEPVSELYSGRTGFLIRNQQPDLLFALVSGLKQELDDWDTFSATVVQGSIHESLLLEAARRGRWHSLVLARVSSPYIPFLETWDSHFASLPKKLRSTMRNGEKRLRERGELAYREFVLPQDIAEFNDAAKSIEADSWKSAAGSAIASNPVHEAFHSTIALRAAENGWFSGHVLYLDGKPIAYIFGLLHNGVFLDLKESYRAPLREMSPGHVLKFFAFPTLYQRGTRWYDFMGTCEEYKMKWTDKIYTRVTYLLFNNTLRGRLARFLGRGWQISGQSVGPQARSGESSEAKDSR